MAHAAFDGWCKPLSSRADPFARASFALLSSAAAGVDPKQGKQKAPPIWPQKGSCTRRAQLQKAAAAEVAVPRGSPPKLPAGAAACWPGLYVSEDDRPSDAGSGYDSDGGDDLPTKNPQRCIRRPADAEAELMAPGTRTPEVVEAEAKPVPYSSTPPRCTRRQRSPLDQPPEPMPAVPRTPSSPGSAAVGTRNVSALARARSFSKISNPRTSKGEDARRKSSYYFGESWLHQLDCDGDGEWGLGDGNLNGDGDKGVDGDKSVNGDGDRDRAKEHAACSRGRKIVSVAV